MKVDRLASRHLNCPCSEDLQKHQMTEVLKFKDPKEMKEMDAVFSQAKRHISRCAYEATGVCVIKTISLLEEFNQRN